MGLRVKKVLYEHINKPISTKIDRIAFANRPYAFANGPYAQATEGRFCNQQSKSHKN